MPQSGRVEAKLRELGISFVKMDIGDISSMNNIPVIHKDWTAAARGMGKTDLMRLSFKKQVELLESAAAKRAAFLGTRRLLVQNTIASYFDYEKFLALNRHQDAYRMLLRCKAMAFEVVRRSNFEWIDKRGMYGYLRVVNGVTQYSQGLLGAFDMILAEEGLDF